MCVCVYKENKCDILRLATVSITSDPSPRLMVSIIFFIPEIFPQLRGGDGDVKRDEHTYD